MERNIYRSVGKFVIGPVAWPVFEYYQIRENCFVVNPSGLENLDSLKGKPYIIAANHLKPEGVVSEECGNSPDAYVLTRAVQKFTGQKPKTISQPETKYWFSEDKRIRSVQKTWDNVVMGAAERLGFIPIQKKSGTFNRSLFRQIEETIAENRPFLTFPEGDWYQDWQPDHTLEQGAASIAKKYNLPIVPAYIRGAASWKPGTKVDVAFGKPFEPDCKTKAEITEQIRQGITNLQQTLQ